MIRLLTALALLACSTQAATYYVSTTGSDSAAGSQAAPWASVAKACMVVQPGDTVLVQPGVYTARQLITAVGTSNAPIVFRADGAVTNKGQWIFQGAGHLVIDGFEVTGGGTYQNLANSMYFGSSGCSNVAFLNNHFHDPPGTWSTAISVDANSSASWITISNNVFQNWGSLQDSIVSARGFNWLVTDNTVTNTYGGDVFRPFGGNHIFRNNRVWFGSAHVNVYGAGNPSFNGIYMYSSAYSALWPGTWVHTNANGFLWISSADKAYGPMGLSNKVSICSPDRSVTYASSSNTTWTSSVLMHNAAIVSPPTGGSGYINHPDFVQVFNDSAPNTYSTNMLFEGNFVRNNIVGAVCQMTAVEPTWPMLIKDFTFRNNVFIDCRSSSVNIRSWWYNNLFLRCGGDSSAISFSTTRYNEPGFRGDATGSWARNNMFIEGGNGAYNQGWYAATPYNSDIMTNCNYNYVTRSATTWAPVRTSGTSQSYAFYEPNGINGGNPRFVNLGGLNFHLLANSPLIDKGTNILTSDYDGFPRPKGSAVDIGPYEFDPSLLMHLDFDQGFENTNVVIDVTGYGHNAWRGNPTSHIAAVSGPKGGTAGRWYQIGTMTNAPPNTYVLSQYLVITNLNGIEFLTNGTIGLWVQWAKYTNDWTGATRHATLLDSGGTTLQFASPPSLATNSWRLTYGPASSTLPAVGPVLSAYSESANWPTNFVQFTHARDESTWHHIVMTWEANGNAIGYENGVPFVTNAFPRPFLRVAGRNPLSPPYQATDAIPWIAVGAASHGGSLTWGDDRYPNDGYFVGKMDDIRIYARPLAEAEVATLYSGNAATSTTPPPGGEPTPEPPVIVTQSESLTVNELSAVTLSVTAGGTAPLTYQWKKGGLNISGATSAVYSISEVSTTHAGTYTCTVSNIAGSATTADIVLTVTPLPTSTPSTLSGIGILEGTGAF